MKVVGLITEYNPFHNGHKYHLEKSKDITKSDYSVVVMSGNFLQRGEPAIVDKWTRAKMAIENNVDLVIELPTIYACQSAEYFAYGSVKLLDSLGIVDNLCFGSEAGEISQLSKISKVLLQEPNEYVYSLKKSLSEGNPYHKARSHGLNEYFKNNSTDFEFMEDVISSPNNILGIEYLKALYKLNSNIKPFTIKRISNDYNQKNLSGKISSATSIRNEILTSEFSNIINTVPQSTYNLLLEYKKKFGKLNNISNYSQLILYLIKTLSVDELKNCLVDYEVGLINRIKKCADNFNDINSVIKCLKTKRYAFTRLQRSMMHILLGQNRNTFLDVYDSGPRYIRVLGMNKRGMDLLHLIKKKSHLPIITKFADSKKYGDLDFNSMISIDKKATDIYYLFAHQQKSNISNLDYITTPYIKMD